MTFTSTGILCCIALHCVVWKISQFLREKGHQWRQIAFNFFPQNPHNNGFHANNRAKLLSLFCTYRQIHTANCNIISISLRILGFIWLVFDQKFGMNELCTMFTNFLLRNPSINLYTMQLTHSLTDRVDCNNRSWLFKVFFCFAFRFFLVDSALRHVNW